MTGNSVNVLDLFSGIGGFSLGLERAGFQTVAFCEIEEFPRKVLAKHWPDVPCYRDIRKLTKERLENDGITDIRLVCGGFPCQPFSVAGKQKGKTDDRHLWPEMLRVIREVEPDWVIGENVTGIINLELDQVLSDLETLGYSCGTFVIPACGVDAPHQRDRAWIVAHTNSVNVQGRDSSAEGIWCAPSGRIETLVDVLDGRNIPKPEFYGTNDGFPNRVDRIKALGNAVVPQIPEIIGRAIMKIHGHGTG